MPSCLLDRAVVICHLSRGYYVCTCRLDETGTTSPRARQVLLAQDQTDSLLLLLLTNKQRTAEYLLRATSYPFLKGAHCAVAAGSAEQWERPWFPSLVGGTLDGKGKCDRDHGACLPGIALEERVSSWGTDASLLDDPLALARACRTAARKTSQAIKKRQVKISMPTAQPALTCTRPYVACSPGEVSLH